MEVATFLKQFTHAACQVHGLEESSPTITADVDKARDIFEHLTHADDPLEVCPLPRAHHMLLENAPSTFVAPPLLLCSRGYRDARRATWTPVACTAEPPRTSPSTPRANTAPSLLP